LSEKKLSPRVGLEGRHYDWRCIPAMEEYWNMRPGKRPHIAYVGIIVVLILLAILIF